MRGRRRFDRLFASSLAAAASMLVVGACHLLSGHADLEPLNAANGQPCFEPTSCQSGFCSDGVCCDAACDGACRACSAAGRCELHADGDDPEGECNGGVCDGAGHCLVGTLLSSERLGGGADQEALRVAVSPTGDILVSGLFEASVRTDGSAAIETLGPLASWLAALDINGGLVGPNPLGLIQTDGGVELASIGTAAWIVAGDHDGELPPLTTTTDGVDIFVARVIGDALTPPSWTLVTGGPGAQQLAAVATDALDNTVIAGRFENQAAIGNTPVLTGGVESIYLASVDGAGSPSWSVGWTAHRAAVPPSGLSVAPGGDMALSGDFEGVFHGWSTPSGAREAFVISLDSAGNERWATRAKGAVDLTAVAVDIAANGDVLALFGANPARGPGGIDVGGKTAATYSVTPSMAVARLAYADGETLWVKSLGSDSDEPFEALAGAADDDGAFVVSGLLKLPMLLGGTQLEPPEGGVSSAIIKLNELGGIEWVVEAKGARVADAAVDPLGDVVVAGSATGQLQLGALPPEPTGAVDGFAAKLQQDGRVTWLRMFADPVAEKSVHDIWPGDGQMLVSGREGGALLNTGFVESVSDDDTAGWNVTVYGCEGVDDVRLSPTGLGGAVVAATYGGCVGLWLDGSELMAQSPMQDTSRALVFELHVSGDLKWKFQLGDGVRKVAGVADDGVGGTIVAVNELSTNMGAAAVLARYADRAEQWQKRVSLGSALAQQAECATAVAASEAGIALAIARQAECETAAERQTPSESRIVFFDPDGEELWTRIVGGLAVEALDVAPDGRVAVAGFFTGLLDSGHGIMNTFYPRGGYVGVLDQAGAVDVEYVYAPDGEDNDVTAWSVFLDRDTAFIAATIAGQPAERQTNGVQLLALDVSSNPPVVVWERRVLGSAYGLVGGLNPARRELALGVDMRGAASYDGEPLPGGLNPLLLRWGL